MTFNAFSRESVAVAAGTVFLRRAGRGPAVLLLHGYPETSLAWRNVAPDLANEFTVIAADLPGYGESTLSESALDDGRISKRTMGRALADVLRELGISQFAVIGHDRGARVAYRSGAASAWVGAAGCLGRWPVNRSQACHRRSA
jgi:haloacetate dehalogenase